MYQYKNDCLAASIEYNKDFYSDRELKPDESISFKLTIPFAEVSSPTLSNNDQKENFIFNYNNFFPIRFCWQI